MKKVVLVSILVAGSLSFFACKENPKAEEVAQPSSVNSEIPKAEMAIANTHELLPTNTVPYLYVTAPSGLSLREYDNLQSAKIAKMPYGTKVKVLQAEGKNTMMISGIPGAMDEIEFNHKKGFAFNGYLSKYFPPERDISVKGYASELQVPYPEVAYERVSAGSKSKPITIETLSIPEAQWHEAFIMAQRLFDFPKEFAIPTSKGKDFEVIKDKKPKKKIWTSQLEITRKDDVLKKIEYVYISKEFKSTVSLFKQGDRMVLSRQEVIQ